MVLEILKCAKNESTQCAFLADKTNLVENLYYVGESLLI